MSLAKLAQIKTIAVVGAGTMGAGIAQVCAQAGYQTFLFDLKQEVVENAKNGIQKSLDFLVSKNKITAEFAQTTIEKITFTTQITALKTDVVIEAIIEKTEPKVELFQKLAEQNGAECILATNTSSIPVTRIAAKVPNPERVVGMHFFNPAQIMKLVEVIKGEATSDEVVSTITLLAQKLGKVAVQAADSPGFIVNRVARPFYVEGLKILEEKVASFEAIDRIMEANGFKMGPFRLMDLIGVDTNFSVTSAMFESFHYESRFRPSRIQQQKVEAGFHGKKTGKGFYNYES